jgi:phenylacetate-CoA ligase
LQYDGIEQFQFIEELNNEYVIKLKMTRPLGSTEEDELVRIYSEYFGHGAKVTIEYVDHIPLLPSGKRKLVINNAIQKPARTKKEIIEETDTMDLVS